ncbi:hypothetical protein DSO57_1035425 [Entomophthora muscae]|uniref:Uncharacterized protein n=1 Tax=Entomophthora muscae TaxID=34485 RepID=A0ACC2SCL9_9FUNG|nr:hypothetical protein DSO57_1035425 [Entomophthora muscae]
MLISLPVLSNNVATAAPANPSLPCLDKTVVSTTELFVEDEPINPLHQFISNDFCAVLTQSQKAALEEEGEAIVALPYTQQIMEMNSVNKNSTYSDCMYCDILVNKVKVRAIIDSSALVNIVSTTLVKQLKIAPDVDYCKQYGNAGPVTTVSQGMYSALPLQFGSLAVSSPVIVFPHKNFDILIGTQFMQNFSVKIDFQENVLKS